MSLRDDQINSLFIQIFLLIILGIGLYYQAGSTGVTITCFTVLLVQVLNMKGD